jgi:hypothetical protein
VTEERASEGGSGSSERRALTKYPIGLEQATSLEVKRVEIDERVGGHYRVWQADSDSDVGGFDCELLELVRAGAG